MQTSVLSLILLQAVASVTASDLPFKVPNAYICTGISVDYSEYCCAQIQTFPGKRTSFPGVEVYNWANQILSGGQVTYGASEPFYSDLCYTVDVVAAYTNSLDGTEWVDDSYLQYADQVAGANSTAPAALAALVKTSEVAELNAAYWFKCGPPCPKTSSTPASASTSMTATASGFATGTPKLRRSF